MTGSGTQIDPYVIWDVNDLQDVRLYDAAYFELGADIDALATAGWFGGAGFEPLDWPYPQKRQPSGDFASVGNWTVFPVVPGTKWDKVDELDQDGDATYIRIDALGGEVLFTFPNFNIPAGATDIEFRMETVSRVEAAGDADGRIYIRVNGTNYETAAWRELADGITYEHADFWTGAFATNPDTGLPWTVDDINGVGPNPLQAWGVRVNAGKICRITKIVALVTCTPPVTLTFDGRGHTITGLSIDRALAAAWYDEQEVGFFRYLDGGEIRNVNLANCSIAGRETTGGIVAGIYDWPGIVTNCHVTGTVSTVAWSAGGIAGDAWELRAIIRDSSFNGTISSYDHLGGIVGFGVECSIISCISHATITGGDVLGGIIGYADDCTITGCSASGTVTGDAEVGGLIGYAWRGTIRNCHSTATVNGNGMWIGGFVGDIINLATVTDCYATGNVTNAHTDQTGGFAGQMWNGTYARCYATGDVVAGNPAGNPGAVAIGGFVGQCRAPTTISQCYATGSVTCYDGLVGTATENGGFVGQNDGGVISNCYARGAVNSNGAGGFAGTNNGGVIDRCYATGLVTGVGCGGLIATQVPPAPYWTPATNSFWDIETTGQTTSDSGTGVNTAQMKLLETFAGWDIESITTTDLAGGYPFLSWQAGVSSVWLIFGAVVPPPLVPTVMTLPATGVT